MRDVGQALNDAYNLIESGDTAGAKRLLQPFIDENISDPDVWWVYAHAVDTPEEGRRALDRVIALSPDYPDAQRLREELSVAEKGGQLRDIAMPAVPPSLPDLPSPGKLKSEPDDEFDFDDEMTTEDASYRRTRLVLLAATAFAVVALLLLIVINGLQSNNATSTPTSVANVQQFETAIPVEVTAELTIEASTEESTASAAEQEEEGTAEATEDASPTAEEPSVVVEATEEAPVSETAPSNPSGELLNIDETESPNNEATAEAAEQIAVGAGDLARLRTSLNSLGVREDGIAIGESTLGSTLLLEICELPGPLAARSILSILQEVSSDLDAVPSDVDAIAVQVISCDEERVTQTIGVSRDEAQAFADDQLDTRAFEAALRPL